MPDLDLNKYYNFLGQRVKIGGVYSDFYQWAFGLPSRAIVYEEGYIPLYFDTIKYIRDHNTDNPGELPTVEKTYYIYAKPDLMPIIGSDPVFALAYSAVPNTSYFNIGFKIRSWQSGDSDYGHWDAQGAFTYHYYNDGYQGVDPADVQGEDHWRQAICFAYFSNIDGYGLPLDVKDRYGIVLQHYKYSVEAQGDPYVDEGYTWPSATEYGVPLPDLDPSYPGEHRVFSYGSFFVYDIDGRANAYFERGVYTAFMGQFEEMEESSPENWFEADDDDTPELPAEGEYDPNGYDGKNDTNFALPTKSVLTSGLFQLFLPTTAELQAFGQYLWSSNYEASLARYGMKPMDNIVNFGVIPFDMTSDEIGSSKELELCGSPTGVFLTAAKRAYYKATLGTITISSQKLSGSFLAFQNSNFNLYLPCIGFVQLKATDVIDRSISIQYRVDLATGDCIAYVITQKGSVKWLAYSYTGNCMYKLPLTSADYASYYQGMRHNATNFLSAGASVLGSTLAGFAAGGAPGAIAGGLMSGFQSISSMFDAAEGLKSNQPEVQRSGGFSGALGYLGYKIPYIIVDYPKPYRKGYNKYYSYPTMRSMELKNCSGWTQVARCDLSGLAATAAEKDMLRVLLKDGIYIKSAT